VRRLSSVHFTDANRVPQKGFWNLPNISSCSHSEQTRSAPNVDEEALRDQFITGLYSPSLRRDLRRHIRDHPTTSFLQARTEAQRWLREDDFEHEVAVQQVATPRDELAQVKEQLALLTQQLQSLQRHTRPAAAGDRGNYRGTPGPMRCWYCNKGGHRRAECHQRRRDEQHGPPGISLTAQPRQEQEN